MGPGHTLRTSNRGASLLPDTPAVWSDTPRPEPAREAPVTSEKGSGGRNMLQVTRGYRETSNLDPWEASFPSFPTPTGN